MERSWQRSIKWLGRGGQLHSILFFEWLQYDYVNSKMLIMLLKLFAQHASPTCASLFYQAWEANRMCISNIITAVKTTHPSRLHNILLLLFSSSYHSTSISFSILSHVICHHRSSFPVSPSLSFYTYTSSSLHPISPHLLPVPSFSPRVYSDKTGGHNKWFITARRRRKHRLKTRSNLCHGLVWPPVSRCPPSRNQGTRGMGRENLYN